MPVKNDEQNSASSGLTKAEKTVIVKKVQELLIKKEMTGWNEGEEKKKEFYLLASRFGIAYATIKNTYYSVVLPAVREKKEKQEKQDAKRTGTAIVQKEVAASLADVPVIESEEELSDKEQEFQKAFMSFNEEMTKEGDAIEKGTSFSRPTLPPYKVNDVIEVRVGSIVDYGVFCFTTDDFQYRGLLHVSEIKDIFVSNPNDYFEVGDIIKAKVLAVQQNRLNFSTRGFIVPLKSKKKEEVEIVDVTAKNPAINVIGEKFGQKLQEKLSTIAENSQSQVANELHKVVKEDEGQFNQKEVEMLYAQQTKQDQVNATNNQVASVHTGEVIPSRVHERDVADVQSFLNNKIGALSPNAQAKLVQILDKVGMFKSTMAISKVSENFVVDYGLIFMEMVARELEKDDCL